MFGGVIDFDPCSNRDSIVAARTEIRLPQNGLDVSWNHPTIYVNPPYGADRLRHTTIRHWLEKCAAAHNDFGSEVIALIPVATNTLHWKKFVFGQAASLCFLADTRLKFLINGSTDNKGAPMACCLVYWGSRVSRFRELFKIFGATVDVSDLISPNNDK